MSDDQYTFPTAYTWTTSDRLRITCPDCNGTGNVRSMENGVGTCARCEGHKSILIKPSELRMT